MQKIITYLWFDGKAEEAMNHYVSIFKNSRVLSVKHFEKVTQEGTSDVSTVQFELEGQTFYGLNGGPHFKFTPAISLFVNCETQEEVDELWNKLISGGGKESQCGWLEDKFGLSWQIIPKQLMELMSDPNPVKSANVMQAMLKMQKIDIAMLEAAYNLE